jgi:hypothetical protein
MRRGPVALLALFLTLPVSAETIVPFSPVSRDNAVMVSAGLDYSILTLKTGYTRAFHVSRIRRTLLLNAGFSLPMMEPDFKDFKFNIGTQLSVIAINCFHVPVSFDFLIRNTANAAYNALGIGIELGVFPGFYSDKLAVASEVSFDSELSTYITFSDYYEDVVYRDGVEGWYGGRANIFRFGARIAYLIRTRVEVFLRGGYELQGKYNLKVPPAYGILGAGIRL